MEVTNQSLYSEEVALLIQAGLEIQENGVWTYAAMSELLRREMAGNDSALQTALQRLARDHAIEFKNIRTEGYLRLDDRGIAGMASPDRQAVRSRVKKGIRRSSNIRDWNDLDEPLKREVDAHRSVLAVMRHILKPASINKVRAEVQKAHDEIDLDKTLDLFRPKK